MDNGLGCLTCLGPRPKGPESSPNARDDTENFARKWATVAPALKEWAARHVRRPLGLAIEPEDLLQEVAFRAWRCRHECHADEGDFRGWTFGIARHVLHEALRRRAVRAAPGHDAPWLRPAAPQTGLDAAEAAARAEDLRQLTQRLAALTRPERHLLVWCGIDGLTQAEAAARLAISPDAAGKRWQRLCRRLRSERLRDGITPR